MMPPLHRWEVRFLFVLVTSAITIRVLFVLEVRDNPFFNNPTSDAYYYDAQAKSIAAGNIFGDDVFFRAPGYPYWLASIYALLGHSYLTVRIIQHLLGVIALLLVYFLSRRLFSPVVAVIASLLMLLNPILLYFEGQILFDWFLTFLSAGWLLLYYVVREEAVVWKWFLVGLLFGVICVTRPTFLPLSIALVGYEMWMKYRSGGKKNSVQVGFALVLGIAVAILPVTVRNYIVAGDFVPIASQGGINFYIGNNPEADGYTARIPTDVGASWEIAEMSYFVEQQLGHRPTPSEESDFWYSKGWRFIVGDPIGFLNLFVRKAYLFWNGIEIPNNLDFYTFSRYSRLLRILPLGFWLIGPLGLVGIVLAWKSCRGRETIVFIGMYAFVMVMFFVCDRYRLPVVPLLCIFGAYTLVTLYNNLNLGEHRQALLLLAGIGIAALFVNSNVYGLKKEEPVHQFYMLGLIAQQHGEYEKAVSYFDQAVAFHEPMRNLYLHRGFGRWMLGQPNQALEDFRTELRYHRDSYGALANLSRLFLERRNLDSAIVYGVQAIKKKPFMPSAYISVAQSYLLNQEFVRAETVLSAGSLKCGESFRYGNCILAGIWLERGDVARAVVGYQSVLESASHSRSRIQGYQADFLIPEEMKTGISDSLLRAKAFYGLGHVSAIRSKLDSAAMYFQKAIHSAPGFADPWADLGVAMLQMKRFPEADSAMRQSLRLAPDNFMYWYNYGSLLGVQGKLVEAKDAFHRCLDLHPNFVPAERDLKFLLKELNR